jgi:hypothetical protein
MKFRNTILLASVLALTACGSMNGGKGPIADQKLATSFVSEKIKIETKCSWFGMGSDCQLVAIESTGTAVSYGGTANNRRIALKRAEMQANVNVSEFLSKEVSSNRVNETLAKNIEKATDRVRSGKADGSTVEMTDQEAKNISLQENQNTTAVTLTETLRTSSRAILKGFVKVKEEVVGDQEVAVTIRWDAQSETARNQLARRMQ